MPSRINSTTTSPGGLISTGDSDNSLLIQTGDTTAITVSSTQVVSLTNPLPAASGGTGSTTGLTALNASNLTTGTVPTARLGSGTANSTTFLRGDSTFATISAGLPGLSGQAFTSNGTFTIPAGVTRVKVTVVGGGGGVGSNAGINCSDSHQVSSGGGGTGISYLSGLTSGNTISVTVGAGGVAGTGGTSTISSGTQTITTITANGGGGQPNVTNGTFSSGRLAGAGGTASGAQINITGQNGFSTNAGGSSLLGLGGFSRNIALDFSPSATAGTGFGSGATGSYAGAGQTKSSANGTSGIVIFEF